MPSNTVNIPEAKGDPLQKSLLKEFDRLRKEMQGLKDTDHSEEILKSLLKQQDHLVKAMERLFQRMTKPSMESTERGVGKRLDRMEDAILKNGSRSRNRTLGSNY